MGLDLPIVGVRTGPLYASDVNDAFDKVDSHNHTSGNGASIPTAGLALDSDLPLNGLNIENVRSLKLAEQGAVLALAGDIGSISNVNGDLYYNNGAGTPVQITSGAGLNFASLGTIGGDYGQPLVNASVVYSNTTKTFAFTQETNQTAKMYLGDIQLADAATVGANAVSIKADALTNAYTTKMPLNLPSAGAVVTVDTLGQQDFSEFNSTNFELSGGEFKVKDNGIAMVKQTTRSLYQSGTTGTASNPDVCILKDNNNTVITDGAGYVDVLSLTYTATNKPFYVDFKAVANIAHRNTSGSGSTNLEFRLLIDGVEFDYTQKKVTPNCAISNIAFSADVSNVLTPFNLPVTRQNILELTDSIGLMAIDKKAAGTYVIKVQVSHSSVSATLSNVLLSYKKLRVFEV